MDGPQPPVISSSDDRTRSWLILAGGLAATAAVVFGLIALWPDDDDSEARTTDTTASEEVTTTTREPRAGTGEPSEQTSTIPTPEDPVTTVVEVADDLFHGDLPAAYADLLAAAGNPAQIIELAVYDGYAFLAYRDPADPGNLDRRTWRDGEVSAAEPNTIDDRVDADTEPSLFGPGEIDPALIARLVADAPTRYELPTEVSHVLVDRFLPFDQRVLIRVYAVPTDGRSGGGYVSYDTAGTLVKVCC